MGYACIYMDLNVISIERIKKITHYIIFQMRVFYDCKSNMKDLIL